MSALDGILSLAFVLRVLQVALPYALGAMGAALTERAGVVDLAIEAKLLIGAFAAVVGTHATDSIAVGLVAAAAAGAAVAMLQWWATVRIGANHVVVGVGLGLIAVAGTRTALQGLYGEGANSPPVTAIGDGVFNNPITYLAVAAAGLVWFLTHRHPIGLAWRAAGDRPAALRAAGQSVARTRAWACALGGALAGLGGAQLSLAVGVFHVESSGGRGYMLLAVVILCGWRPLWSAVACIGFAVTEALNVQLQLVDTVVPRELAPLLPHLTVLVVLAIVGGARRQPAALGDPDA